MDDSPYSIPELEPSTPKKVPQNRTVQKRQAFLEYYHRSMLNVSATCRAAGITRKTFYNWCDKDPQFREAIKVAEQYLQDDVEGILMRNIRRGHMPSVWFWLKRRHPAYIQRRLVYHSLYGNKTNSTKTFEELIEDVNLKNLAYADQLEKEGKLQEAQERRAHVEANRQKYREYV